ncbi:helix-hairpin-helix domain-containing protein [Sphingomonas sp.]|jgi:predicted flap endonuclease-1-like 5' DNA nuclease|uniref:helix-hairpin-helix domain-containing protein n=1 Tax=Sphingomonas sp. TaxID=28214 RepID=UPI002E38054C|nr:helix-hairpin-helix domain-containing protein [Sphingomonas sp.]HEX4692910.1 helix-hairpin-helix domain-containing protein [Sphingomonas sp.]
MQTPVTVGGAADAFYGWTIIQLILMALAAVAVVAGMLYGRRLAHQRHRAQQAAEERAEEAGIELPPEQVADGETIAAVEPEAEAGPTPGTPRDPGYELAPAAPAEDQPEPEPEPEPARPAAAPEPEPEPVAAAAPQAAPAVEPEAAPAVEPAIAGALALTTIKGLGPKVAAMLAERGITRVDQIAALTPDDAAALDVQLGAFTGRMTRDRWIDQARLLASGDTAGYEAEFGKLG